MLLVLLVCVCVVRLDREEGEGGVSFFCNDEKKTYELFVELVLL